MRELNKQEVSLISGGIVVLIPPVLTFAVKVFGMGIGVISGSLATYSAYLTIKER